MKPLHHPAVADLSVEGILYALSDPVRVRILAEIAQCEEHKTCSTFLTVNNRAIPKSTLSQHFKVLREAGLIRSVRKGVELHNTTRCAENGAHFGELIRTIIEAYAAQDKRRKRKR